MALALEQNAAATPPTATVTARQTVAGWASNPEFPANFTVGATTAATGKWTLTYTKDDDGLITGMTATFG